MKKLVVVLVAVVFGGLVFANDVEIHNKTVEGKSVTYKITRNDNLQVTKRQIVVDGFFTITDDVAGKDNLRSADLFDTFDDEDLTKAQILKSEGIASITFKNFAL